MEKLKHTLTIFSCSLISGLTLIAQDYEELADYLLLTRDLLPKPATLIDGCLENLNFDSESLESYQKKQRLSYLMPELFLGAQLQENRANDFEFVENARVDTNSANSFEGYTQTGYADSTRLEATLRWDLRDLVYDVDEQVMMASYVNEENERHFLFSEISRRYGALYSLLPEESGQKLSKRKVAQIIESAAVLDVMSGFVISKTIRKRTETDATPIELSRIKGSANEADGEEDLPKRDAEDGVQAPELLQVDDGMDDTFEKAF